MVEAVSNQGNHEIKKIMVKTMRADPLAGGLWAWWRSRNKKADVMQVEIVEKKSPLKRKK